MESGHFDAFFIAQQGRCAICSELMFEVIVDHDHKTGNLRGLLCRKCNALLGMASDQIEIIRRAVQYLEKWEHHEPETLMSYVLY